MQTSSSYYLRSRGRMSGPFDLASLQQMARIGKVSRFDHLSTDRTTWWPAAELKGLFHVRRRGEATPPLDEADEGYGEIPLSGDVTSNVGRDANRVPTSRAVTPSAGAPRSSESLPRAGGHIRRPPPDVPPSVEASQMNCRVTYLVASILAMLFDLMPVFIIKGTAVWWWDMGWLMVAYSVYLLVASVILLIVTPLVDGLARPIVVLSLILLPLVYGLSQSAPLYAKLDALTIVTAIAAVGLFVGPPMLIASNNLREWLPRGGPFSTRLWQAFAGTVTALSALAEIVREMLKISSEFSLNGQKLVAVVFFGLATVAAFAAGVLAVIAAAKPRLSHKLCTGSTAAVGSGYGLVVLGGVFLACGPLIRQSLGSNSAAVAFVVLRFIIIGASIVAFFIAASNELFTWIYRRHAPDAH